MVLQLAYGNLAPRPEHETLLHWLWSTLARPHSL